MKVKLERIVNALDRVDDMNDVYYVPDSGEIGFVNQEVTSDIPENAIFLPSRFDIREYSIMERYIYTLDGEIYEELTFAINGRGASRNFKHLIHRYDIHEEWYDYREQAFIHLAKEWCDSHDIEYI